MDNIDLDNANAIKILNNYDEEQKNMNSIAYNEYNSLNIMKTNDNKISENNNSFINIINDKENINNTDQNLNLEETINHANIDNNESHDYGNIQKSSSKNNQFNDNNILEYKNLQIDKNISENNHKEKITQKSSDKILNSEKEINKSNNYKIMYLSKKNSSNNNNSISIKKDNVNNVQSDIKLSNLDNKNYSLWSLHGCSIGTDGYIDTSAINNVNNNNKFLKNNTINIEENKSSTSNISIHNRLYNKCKNINDVKVEENKANYITNKIEKEMHNFAQERHKSSTSILMNSYVNNCRNMRNTVIKINYKISYFISNYIK